VFAEVQWTVRCTATLSMVKILIEIFP